MLFETEDVPPVDYESLLTPVTRSGNLYCHI